MSKEYWKARAEAAEKEVKGFEEFHPRAIKLLRKRKNFLVVAEDEPYFKTVYDWIRNGQIVKKTWTEEDEHRYQLATQPKSQEMK